MFKIKQKLNNIYDLLVSFNNNERVHTKSVETMMNNYKEDSIRLTSMCENAKKVLEEKDAYIKLLDGCLSERESEIQRLTKIIEENNKFQEKVEQHLETVATIAKNVHKSRLEKKMSAVAYTRNNMTDETKAKLK